MAKHDETIPVRLPSGRVVGTATYTTVYEPETGRPVAIRILATIDDEVVAGIAETPSQRLGVSFGYDRALMAPTSATAGSQRVSEAPEALALERWEDESPAVPWVDDEPRVYAATEERLSIVALTPEEQEATPVWKTEESSTVALEPTYEQWRRQVEETWTQPTPGVDNG